MDLPALDEAEQTLLSAMRAHLAQAIRAAGGALPFDRYMELALYAPGLGYYVNGRRKLGEGGDFVTAPELSPVFGACVANQVAECLGHMDGGSVLEFGAGSGRLAADMLLQLARLESLPRRYLILEVSPDLRALQRATLAERVPQLLDRVEWLDGMPAAGFVGVVVANELLDAMPVHRFRRGADGWQELAVVMRDESFEDHWTAVHSPGLVEALARLWPGDVDVSEGYSSEINLRLGPWLAALASRLERGYLLLIDYGYTQREYYHPERRQGTLICHFRHRAYADPYLLPGLQDITANVDFSAVAQSAVSAGMQLAGYTTQAHFLIDNGLDRQVSELDFADIAHSMQVMQGVKRLTLPSEMGERFKVIALAADTPATLAGFRTRDLRERL